MSVVWSASIGSKGFLQKAWVRVRNIPPEKRCEAHAYYAASLVGVPLGLDMATLHRPEYVKVLLGCRDVEEIPATAEGCLGDHFYDFYYEVDKVVVGGPPKNHITVSTDHGADDPVSKRPRVEHSSVQESSEEQTLGGSTSDNRYGKTCPINMEPVSEHESEDDTDDDQGLLIDQIALENAQKEAAGDASVSSESLDVRGVGLGVNVSKDMGKAIVPVQSAWMSPLNIAPLTPVVNKENIISEVAPSVMRHKEVSSYYQTLDKVVWPPLPRYQEWKRWILLEILH
jgi:hypothetical protein